MPEAIEIGQRYRIEALIGQGMRGPVYRGVDTLTGKAVAIKVLESAPGVPEVERQPEQRAWLERYQREDEILSELHHPNIVQRLAAIEQAGIHYIITEFVPGGSLRDLLNAQTRLSMERALEIALDLSDALARAHRLGIIHRDLKAENVLLEPDGTPRLSDFGLALSLHHPSQALSESLVGTWAYIAPETYQGLAADERTDIWSFGVLLYEMLAGQTPFEAGTPAEVIDAVLYQPIPTLHSLRPDLPEDLYRLVDRMLNRQRDARPPSIRIVSAALEAIAQHRSVAYPISEEASQVQLPPNNLPVQSTSFIGRQQEVATLANLLVDQDGRLVTLTGPGGVGKTRLALQAAGLALAHYPDGIFFVDLSPIVEAGFAASRIAQAFGIKESHSRSLIDDIKDYLRDKRLLLLLDNFEQIVSAAPIITEFLFAAPELRVLVTSREALRLYGEHEYPVSPLCLPEEAHLADQLPDEALQALSANESIALFVQRAQAVNPEFQLTTDNAAAVARICIHLDGLPLAIELAAARSKLFSPQFLLNLLTDAAYRAGVLTGGPRDLTNRHQTLQAAIDWSYNLLDANEKILFARLAVFQGGRSLPAIQAIACDGLGLDALSGLESLHNKSLVQKKERLDGEPYFVLLETIHSYARQQLAALGDEHTTQSRHASYFLDLAERAEPELRASHQEYWSTYLRQEYDNLRAVLNWSLSPGRTIASAEIVTGLRLASALSEFWYYEGPISEGEKWIQLALTYIDQAPEELRARVWNGAGMMAFAVADYEHGKLWSRQALEVYRKLGDKSGIAWSLNWLSAFATNNPHEYAEGVHLCEETLALYQELNYKPGLAWAYNQLGELTRLTGDYARARQAYQASYDVCQETGNRRRGAIALVNLSYTAQHQGDYVQAEKYALGGLRLLSELKLKYHSTIVLAMLAGPVAALGKARQAATLLGASEAIFESMNVALQPADQVEIDGYVASARTQLGQAEFEMAWGTGRQMSFEQAVAFALAG